MMRTHVPCTMNKRRLQPKDGTPKKRQKISSLVTGEQCDVEVPMIHRIPLEILDHILELTEWKDKLRLMQASRHLLGIVPKCIYELNFTLYAPYITSQEVVASTLQRCIALTSLVLDCCKLGKRHRPFCDALLGLTKLKTLSLVGTDLPFSVLSQVHKLSNLEQLRLAGTNVTDKVLESLRNLSNLQTLDLGRTPLKPKGKWTTWLTYFTTLQALRLDAIPMKDVNSDFLISLSNLQKLDLSDTECRLLPAITSLPQLQSLIYIHKDPQDPALFADHQFPPLTQLIIDYGSLPVVHPLPSLIHLELVDLRDDFISIHEKFSNLQSLELSKLRESGTNMAIVLRSFARDFANLETLNIDLSWSYSLVGKFDHNFSNMITKLPLIRTLRSFYLRVFMDVDTDASIDITWQSLISVLIQQKTVGVLRDIPNCEIALVLKGGEVSTGRSLICRYKDRQWATTKRWVTSPADEIKLEIHNK